MDKDRHYTDEAKTRPRPRTANGNGQGRARQGSPMGQQAKEAPKLGFQKRVRTSYTRSERLAPSLPIPCSMLLFFFSFSTSLPLSDSASVSDSVSQ